MKQISINVNDELHRQLRVTVAERGTTITALVLDCIEQAVKAPKPPQPADRLTDPPPPYPSPDPAP